MKRVLSARHNISASSRSMYNRFKSWYNKLTPDQRGEVYKTADLSGIPAPDYDKATDDMLQWLMDQFNAKFNSIDYIQSVTEPSASEYGRFLSEANKRMQDRYAPFKLKATYFCRGRSNSTGYRIQLGSDEWIADNGGEDSWNSDYGYKLYGAFNIDEIESWSELFRYKPLVANKFKTIDSVMTYLFNNVDTDLEERYEDAKQLVESSVAKKGARVKKIEEGADFVSYEGPDGDVFDFDLTESEYDMDIQLESFSMWCLDNGAIDAP